MRPSTNDHAALSADAYNTYPREKWEEGVVVNGTRYEILDQVSRPSGYEGTIYRNTETNAIVVAHRGTEFDRQLVRDGLIADGGMVLVGANAQANDAMALTQRGVQIAERRAEVDGQMPSVSVTGHSLGGTLAQISAHRLGLHAETFNAYGAAGLTADLPRNDDRIVNYVRATDYVSAASAHVGEVRVFATQPDIDALERSGYANDNRRLTDLRNPFGVLGTGTEAHYGSNFVGATNIMTPENEARYRAHQPMVDKYRDDIAGIHGVVALPRNAVDAVVDTVRDIADGPNRQRQAPAEPNAPPGAQVVPLRPEFDQLARAAQAGDIPQMRALGEQYRQTPEFLAMREQVPGPQPAQTQQTPTPQPATPTPTAPEPEPAPRAAGMSR